MRIDVKEKRYEYIKQIGKGATACVYQAKDCMVGRIVAIKMIYDLEIGRHECMILQGLHQKGIPNVFDYFEENENSFLVMEYIDGISLRAVIEKKGALEEQKCILYLLELAEILFYLHNLQTPIIYMDLKPENIIIAKNNQVYLIDYGAACYKYEQAKKWYGTKKYAPPELLEEQDDKVIFLDERVDIYSFGTVGIFMKTGVLKGELPYTMIVSQLQNYFIDVRLENVLIKCVHEKREKRYRNMKEVIYYMKNCTKMNHFKNICGVMSAIVFCGMILITAYAGGSLIININLLEWQLYVEEIKSLSVMIMVTILFQLLIRRRFSSKKLNYKSVTHFMKMSNRVGISILIGLIFSTEIISYSKEEEVYPIGLSVVEEPQRMVLVKEGTVYFLDSDVTLSVRGYRIESDYVISYNHTEWIPLEEEEIEIKLSLLETEEDCYSVRVKYEGDADHKAKELLLATK